MTLDKQLSTSLLILGMPRCQIRLITYLKPAHIITLNYVIFSHYYMCRRVMSAPCSGGALHGLGWATAHPKKIKKSTIIGLLCEILYNFMSVLGFG